MKRVAVLCLFAVTSVAPAAHAAVEDTFGLGPRALALGGSYAARPGDFAAVYYNPAGLSPGQGAGERGGYFQLSLAALAARPVLYVTRDGGGEVPVPETPSTVGVVAGARYSVGQPFGIDGLDMGLSVYVPDSLFQWAIRPDDDVQWALLTDRTQVLSTHVGLAYRLTPWLSLGVGLRALFDAQTLTRGEVTSVEPATDPRTGKSVIRTSTRLGTDGQVFGRVSPLAGVLVTPNESLRVGLVYRHKSLVDDWGDTRITGVPGLGNLGYTHRFAHYFEPTQVTAAAGVDLGGGLDVSVDLTWARWSEALSTNHNDLSAGLWGDTLVPAFGARQRLEPHVALLGGYRFVRSPLDNFGGPTNLLDNDRHVLSLGTEVDVAAWCPCLPMSITLGLSSTLLVERHERKDFRRFESDEALQDNPGYPGYRHGGHVLAGSLGLEAKF